MTLADRITLVRVFLAPVFFALYRITDGGFASRAVNPVLAVALLWIVFVVAEITDWLDGMAARRMNQSSDFGRLFDPFADTLVQLAFFLCFVLDGILPAALFLVVLYREFGILFVRNLMLKKGVTMGARLGGKIKTVAYIATCSAALAYSSLLRLDALAFLHPFLRIASVAVFAVSVALSVVSFFDYVSVYRSAGRIGPGPKSG